MNLLDWGLLLATAIASGFAIWSARSAHRSANEAERSSKAAEGSLELARSERDRAIEPSDIHFEQSPRHTEGVYTYTNVGTSDAYDVTVLAEINDKLEHRAVGNIPSGGSFVLDGSAQLAESQRKQAARNAASDSVFIIGPRLVIRARIS